MKTVSVSIHIMCGREILPHMICILTDNISNISLKMTPRGSKPVAG